MPGLGYPAQPPRVVLVARAQAAQTFPFLHQRLQVVEHQQGTLFTQVFQQQAQASFRVGKKNFYVSA